MSVYNTYIVSDRPSLSNDSVGLNSYPQRSIISFQFVLYTLRAPTCSGLVAPFRRKERPTCGKKRGQMKAEAAWLTFTVSRLNARRKSHPEVNPGTVLHLRANYPTGSPSSSTRSGFEDYTLWSPHTVMVHNVPQIWTCDFLARRSTSAITNRCPSSRRTMRQVAPKRFFTPAPCDILASCPHLRVVRNQLVQIMSVLVPSRRR